MRWLVVVSLVGCYSPSPKPGAPCSSEQTCPTGLVCETGICVLPGGGGVEDAAIDATIVDMTTDVRLVDGCTTFSEQFDTCALPEGMAHVLDTGVYLYNTDTHILQKDGVEIPVTHAVVDGQAGPLDVIVASTFAVLPSVVLRAIGSRPFGIVATQTITIEGVVDVSEAGAGARSAGACGASAGRPMLVPHIRGPGGAGGGGFRGRGGDGGDANGNEDLQVGALGGEASTVPAGPLGGCPGGAGGVGVAPGGAGGMGGGALYLASAARIALTATAVLHAGGGPGLGGMADTGSGGGGGSGGSIWLESPVLALGGRIAANGGGGGEGANDTNDDGEAGTAGQPNASPAPGGDSGTADGGDGGDGSGGNVVDGFHAPDGADDAGGGGGGGAGFIVLRGSRMGSALMSPPPL